MTARVVTKDDIEHVLGVIKREMLKGSIDLERGTQYKGIAFFGAFTGQRPYSAIAQLRVEQFRDALQHEKPVLHVESAEDKIRMEHYVPMHLQLASVMETMCDGRLLVTECLRRRAFASGCRNRGYRSASVTVTSSLRIFASLLSSTAMLSDGMNLIAPIF